MIVTFSIFGVLQLLVLYPVHLEAQISFPDGNATYWLPGSSVKLPWEIKFSSSDVFGIQWSFTRSGSTQVKNLAALGVGSSVPVIYDPTFNIIDGAALVFQNANLSHNGTYSLAVTLTSSAGGNTIRSNVLVIILEQPSATTNCSRIPSLKEGENITCLCNGTNGNPPPTASWSKDGKVLSEEYLKSTLMLTKVEKDDNGTYICKVRSHNLTDEEQVPVIVKYKPTDISFTSDKVNNFAIIGEDITLTCNAKGNPKPHYEIIFNGTVLEDSEDGMVIIKNVNYGDNGTYVCVARNSQGELRTSINVTTGEKPSTTTPTTTSSTTSTTTVAKRPSPEETSDFPVGAIAGIAIGILFAIIIAVALVYWCYFKNSNAHGICGCTKKEDNGEGDQVVNHDVTPYDQPSRAENPYESVDGEKINSGEQAGPSGNTSTPPEGNSGLPPVYAVVDKNKKTKKPPPKSQPPSVTYASLDPVDLQPDSSKMRDRYREETNYADIDLGKLQSDLV